MSHLHSIYDTDKHFIIDPKTRLITTESESLTLIQYDHNSKCYTFEIPRYIEGHDMSQCNKVEIHYDNISKDRITVNHDFYTVTDLRVSEEDDTVILFSWTISNSATQLVGRLQFGISFECVSEDSALDYCWSTYYFDKVKVNAVIYNEDHVIAKHSDFVDRMEMLAKSTELSIDEFRTNYEQNVHYEQTVKEATDILTPLADTLQYMTYRERTLFRTITKDEMHLEYPGFNNSIYFEEYNQSFIKDLVGIDSDKFRDSYDIYIHFAFESDGYAYGAPEYQNPKLKFIGHSTHGETKHSTNMCFTPSFLGCKYISDSSDDSFTVERFSNIPCFLTQLSGSGHSNVILQIYDDAVYNAIVQDIFETTYHLADMSISIYKTEYVTPKELSDALDALNGEVV